MMNLQIKRLERGGKRPNLPQYQTEGSAARDIQAFLPKGDVTVEPGQTVRIPTGLCMAIEPGWGGFLLARSGLATKSGVSLANGVGLIDSDYRGEVLVALVNRSRVPFVVHDGERIAQLVLLQTPRFGLEERGELELTARGAGGFGSTGRL